MSTILVAIVGSLAGAFALTLWSWFEADRVHMRLYEVDLELAQSLRNSFVSWRDEGSESRFGRLLKNELLRHPDAEVRRLALRVRWINRAAGALVLPGFLAILWYGLTA